ncbi:hypothetical protein ACGFH8_28825 [Micromonospora sp. NPDC049175]|uniref:hypothetical protein n=1 Tax=Micromonospora sp. NPDC049175 TaxID=3364266 RepID=UPI003711E608
MASSAATSPRSATTGSLATEPDVEDEDGDRDGEGDGDKDGDGDGDRERDGDGDRDGDGNGVRSSARVSAQAFLHCDSTCSARP